MSVLLKSGTVHIIILSIPESVETVLALIMQVAILALVMLAGKLAITTRISLPVLTQMSAKIILIAQLQTRESVLIMTADTTVSVILDTNGISLNSKITAPVSISMSVKITMITAQPRLPVLIFLSKKILMDLVVTVMTVIKETELIVVISMSAISVSMTVLLLKIPAVLITSEASPVIALLDIMMNITTVFV
jgi:hypothetical protein